MSKLTIAEVNAKIEKHEAVCAERWLEVLHRVTRLEQFILITLITLVLSMAGIIFNIYTGD
jgi:cell division protein FtsL